MFKQLKRMVGQTKQDARSVQNGDTEGALKRRLRPAATKNAPGGPDPPGRMGRSAIAIAAYIIRLISE